jgi:nitrite reductase (NO-forming)/hydroxylamine reductase
MKHIKLSRITALVLSALAMTAMAQDKKGVTAAESNYQAASSPMVGEAMVQSINPNAPPMTKAEFDVARKFTSSVALVATACCARVPPASR